MKGLSSKHIALKVDVTEAENILFTGASFVEVLQAGAVMGLYRRRLIHKTGHLSRTVELQPKCWCLGSSSSAGLTGEG